MKSTNLRNKPVDKRRLSAQDKAQYKSGNRQQAVARARQRKGQMAWNDKVRMGKQEQKPGTGGFTSGLGMQIERNRQEGAKVERAKALREVTPDFT